MYDSIIIGGGISGLTSALYLARAGLKVMVLEKYMCGGQIINSESIMNYPGIVSISGFELINNIKRQLENYETIEIKYENVIKIDNHKVITENNTYESKTIIIASGLIRKNLGLDHESELIGSGVSYCATCDGNFFKNKIVTVVGGGNTALEDSLYLANITSKVYLIIRSDKFRGDKILVDKVKNTNNIEIIYNSQVTKLLGNPLSSIEINNEKTIDTNGLFIAIGSKPNTEFCSSLIELDQLGYIKSDNCKTNIEYIFASGDVRTKSVRQLVTASGDGAISANLVLEYLNN